MEQQVSTHVDEIRKRLEAYIEDKDFGFNPVSDTVDGVIRAMDKRFEKFGKDYCPCRRVTGDAEKDEMIVCPCVYHLDELEKDGMCHCQLFAKKQA